MDNYLELFIILDNFSWTFIEESQMIETILKTCILNIKKGMNTSTFAL